MKLSSKPILFIGCFLLTAAIQPIFAQCLVTDNRRSILFITYERTAKIKIDGSDKLQDGVILRLHNNSPCTVNIESGSADKFHKPFPVNPTINDFIKGREIDYDLPDSALVPRLQYYYTPRKSPVPHGGVGGDMFFGFNLLGNRSLLFEVPIKHLDFSFAGKIEVRFQYAWELENRATFYQPSVEHVVRYWTGELPDEVKRRH